MEQTMKSKASDQCSIGTEGLVLSTKGTSSGFKSTRGTATILKQRSMNQYENNFNRGPLTVSGFMGGSCCQVILPVSDRTPVKPAAKGEHRLKVNSCIGLSAFGYVVAEDFRSGKLKRKLTINVDNRVFLCYEINLPGTPECVDMTEFREQRNWLADSPEKTGRIAPNTHIFSFTQFDLAACIYLCKSIQMPYRTGNMHSARITLKPKISQIILKKPLRRRKSKQFRWRIESPVKREHHTNVEIKIYNGFSNN